MTGISAETLLKTELFAWTAPEDLEVLANCFDWEEERLAAGEHRKGMGRIGCLLEGAAGDAAGHALAAGAIFGLTRDGEPDPKSAVTARTDCRILWMDGDIMTSVCYRACWFHGRFVTEVRKRLERQG